LSYGIQGEQIEMVLKVLKARLLVAAGAVALAVSARYLAVALDSLETGTQSDPAVLQRLRPLARSFTLADGEPHTLRLEISAPQ
jgi:hypothetical protein